jgi:hypothetical protein
MSLYLSRFSSLATLLLLSMVACGGGGDDDGGDGGDGPSAECLEAENHSDLEWIQDNIFTGTCALSASCHSGAATLAQDLNLEPGNAEADLVGVPAQGDFAEGLNLVEPGDPDNSYLMVVLGQFGTDDPRLPEDSAGDKITMPDSSTGLDILCQEERDAIARWISSL